MKITDMQLLHYGIYQNISWKPATDRLIVIMGENESGKTTMLRFIRDMLFGYPRGEWRAHQGNLGICRQDGEHYRIYRMEKESWYEDATGKKLGEDVAASWWHGLDRGIYEKIFAVGLEDLQGAGFLANEEVRSRFFLLSGGDTLTDARMDFCKQKEQLLLPSSAAKRRINVLLEKKRALSERLSQLSGDEEIFAQSRTHQAEVQKEIEERQTRLRTNKEEARSYEKRLGAWNYYERAREIRRQLDLSEKVKHFPQNGKEQWNGLMNRMQILHEQKEELEKKLAEHTPKRLEEVIPWAPEAETLESLYRDLGRWNATIEEAQGLIAEKNEWRESFAALGKTLPHWKAPLSPDEKYASVDWDDGRRLAQGVSVRQNEYHFWAKREPEVEETDAEYENVVPVSEEDWHATEEAAQKAETLVRDRIQCRNAYEALSQKKDSYFTLWFYMAILFLLAGCGALYAFYTAVMGIVALYGTVAAGGLCLLCVVVNHYAAGKKAKKMARLSAELSEIEKNISEAAEKIPVPIPEKEEDLGVFRNAMQQKRGEFYKALAASQALSWKLESIERQRREHEKWEEEGKTLAAAKEDADREWENWLAQNHLPNVSAEDLAALQEEWQIVYTEKGAGNILSVRLDRTNERLRDFEARAKAIIEKADPNLPVTPETVEEIYKENTKRLLAWQSIFEKNRQHEGYEKEMESNRRQWEVSEAAMKLLFESVGAQNAEEFAERVNAYEQHDRLVRDWETVQKDIRLYAGSNEEFERLWALLGTGEYDEWKQKHDEILSQIEEDETALAALRKEEGAVESEIRRLANDEAITKVLQEENEVDTDLRQALESWLTYVYTDHFLERAQSQYESGERPKILEAANGFLRQMTQERYGLEVSDDGKKISTVDAMHDKKDAKIWSSGTGDQVYLSLRLAMALSFGEQLEPLPIVLDDIFVRFDETRQRQTLRFLMELGKQTQIFLFTCHAQTMHLAEEIGKEMETGEFVRLENGTVKVE